MLFLIKTISTENILHTRDVDSHASININNDQSITQFTMSYHDIN